MKLAIFGGTFDPVHVGHLLLAESARQQSHLDRVIFLPVGVSPHKKQPVANALQRLAMVRKAIRGNPFFRVSAWEINARRKVYTYQTLQHFKTLYPRARLFFIVGSDSLRDLPGWRHGTDLLRQCEFLVVEREDAPWKALDQRLRSHSVLVQSPVVGVASRRIRAAIAQQRSVRYQVPSAVGAYISQQRLYRKVAS